MSIVGSNNPVDNSFIHDFGYMGGGVSGVYFKGSGNSLTHSTISRSGRSLVDLTECANCKLIHNLLYSAAILTTDNGAIYAFGKDLQNTEIAYNWIRVFESGRPTWLTLGIYLDNGIRNTLVHHNVLIELGQYGGIAANTPHENHLFCNNTLVHDRVSVPPGGNPKDYYQDIGEMAYCSCNFDQAQRYFEGAGECTHTQNSNGTITSTCGHPNYPYWINSDSPLASQEVNPRRLKVFNIKD